MVDTNKPRVVLVNPCLGQHWEDYPMGLLSIGAVLERAGYPVRLIDLNFEDSWDVYRAELEREDFDIVGVTGLSLYADSIFAAARIAKEINGDCVTVLGGPHATAVPEDSMEREEIDLLVYGEGEETILDLLAHLTSAEDLANVPGLYIRAGGELRYTGQRAFIQDLDSLPFPARHMLKYFDRYLEMHGGDATTLMAGRGCPGKCVYCQPVLRKLFGRRMRLRSARNVADEIEMLYRTYGIKVIHFRDDTTCAVNRWLKEFADEITGRNLPIEWWGSARVNNITSRNIGDIRRSRCVALTFGVESGSQRILDVLQKGTTPEQALKARALCKGADVLFLAAIMIGCPTETKEEIEETIRFVRKLDPDVLDPHITTATPGSELFYMARRMGFLDGYDYRNLTDRVKIAHNFSEVSDGELEELLGQLWRTYRMNRRGSRAYWRWRYHNVRTFLAERKFVRALQEIGVALLKGRGEIYTALWLVVQLLRFAGILKKGREKASVAE